MVDDNNNNKFKLNKNNRRAIITMLSFFILISATFLISEFINVKKYFPGGTVVNAEGSPVDTEIINVVSDKTEAKTEVSTTEAVSTEKVTTEVTEKPTEKVTEKPTEKKTEKTTEKAEDKTEKTTKETTEKKDNPEPKEDVKLDMDTDVPELPAVAEIKGNDFADSKLFTPNKVVGEDYFDNTVFIGENKSFWVRNRRSEGYLLKRRIKSGAVSVIRALLMFGLCFMIIQPMLTRFAMSLMAVLTVLSDCCRC